MSDQIQTYQSKQKKRSELKRAILISLTVLIIGAAYFYLGRSFVNQPNDDRPTAEVGALTVMKEAIKSTDLSNKDLGNFYIYISRLEILEKIVTGVDPSDPVAYNAALKNDLAHMTGTALPGSGSGNVFIYGHSSSNFPKYIFTKLNDLVDGDEIHISYKQIEYTYIVNGKKIVEKNDLSVLDPTANETISLMSCWPIGTDDQRIIVTASRKY